MAVDHAVMLEQHKSASDIHFLTTKHKAF